MNCVINLILTLSEKHVLTDSITHAALAAQRDNPKDQQLELQEMQHLK